MPKFRETQAEAKRQQKLNDDAEEYLQNKLDRKTHAPPDLDAILASRGCWKYGGIFNMPDGEVHYRITIPDLGRVIHCHTSNAGHVLTRAHLKPKIKEVGWDSVSSISAAAKKGKLTRNTPGGLKLVSVHDAKGISAELEEIVRDKLMKGVYSAAIVTAAQSLDDIELTFYANGAYPAAHRQKYRQVIQKIISVSPEILFPCPA